MKQHELNDLCIAQRHEIYTQRRTINEQNKDLEKKDRLISNLAKKVNNNNKQPNNMKNKETFKQFIINYINNKLKTLLKESELSLIKAIVNNGNKTDQHTTKESKSTRNHITKESKSTRKYISKKLNPLSKDVKEILESQKRIETKIDYLYDQLNIKYEEDKRTNVEILKSLSSFPIYTTKDNTNTPF